MSGVHVSLINAQKHTKMAQSATATRFAGPDLLARAGTFVSQIQQTTAVPLQETISMPLA